MSKDFCSLSINCDSNCPKWIKCPLDSIDNYSKDRSTSRNRHHSMLKERNSAQKNVEIISAKLACIPPEPDKKVEIETDTVVIETLETKQKRKKLNIKLKHNKSKFKKKHEEKE